MYTGIVHGAYTVTKIRRRPGLNSLSLTLPAVLLEGLDIGASVGIDGVCMTVTSIDGALVSFDAMQQTLSLTTLGDLEEGQYVNVERSAKQGAEIGGHLISGHVDATAELVAIEQPENNCTLRFKLPSDLMKYVFAKGFIGLHGCSLTVAELEKTSGIMSVCLIPGTLRSTNLGRLGVGSRVNIEVDRQTQAIVDTVERVLAERELQG